MNQPLRPFYTVRDLALRLDCGRESIYAAIRAGALKAAAINKRGDLRISEAAVRAWLASQTAASVERRVS